MEILDMKKILLILSALFSVSVMASEAKTISISSPYSPGHGGHASMMRVLEIANQSQNKYFFVQENRPGAQGVIALRHTHDDPASRLAIIHAAFVDNLDKNLVTESDYVPVHAIGDACWAVAVIGGLTDKNNLSSIKGINELVIGTVGLGNVTHLTGIAIAEKQNIKQRLVLFKSNYDAVVNLVGGHGVNFVVERVSVLSDFRTRNPALRMVAMSCPERHPDAPTLPTLSEQGFDLPSVFNIVVAHKNMPSQQQKEIGKILDQATLAMGKEEIRRMSDFISPVFENKMSAQKFYDTRISAIKKLRTRYKSQISADK